ncbi:hypothetical protein BS78_06G261400 [Paspalum vaginatum]|nr:hypothetical protein BS78_06G261400 [Paspalum vaginatum]
MPLQYAAQSACISHTFLRSWRCHPYLNFTEETLFLKQNASREGYMARHFIMRVDKILGNHSGIGVKTLMLAFPDYCKDDFPCSLLFGGRGNSIRCIRLTRCAFRPLVGFDCLKSLTELFLWSLTSNCFALEKLELAYCGQLIFLKIPLSLERLSFLRVSDCFMLQVIESKAPNLFTFAFNDYDYLSLVSFLDASPSLETFILTLDRFGMKHDSAFGDAFHMRQVPGHKHSRLRKVNIIGFYPAKSMVELTCHILENATSLESLIVDTIYNPYGNRHCAPNSRCFPVERDTILERHKALKIVNMYIVGRATPTVKLDIRELCSRCHAI